MQVAAGSMFQQRHGVNHTQEASNNHSGLLNGMQHGSYFSSTINESGISLDKKAPSEHTYIIKVCEALLMFGAPFHRLEEYASRTAEALGMKARSFYMPNCMLVYLSDTLLGSHGDFYMVRQTQSLNLAKLFDVRQIYKETIHGKVSVIAATAQLDAITAAPDRYSLWFRVLAYGFTSATAGPLFYNANPLDLPIIFLLGTLIGYFELILAARVELFAPILEVSSAVLTAFLGRAFGSINWTGSQGFCFSAISQASLVMILPGLMITNSALELQTKNIISGSG